MERIYTDTSPGRHRFHLEIDEGEVADLLDDLRPLDHDVFAATKELVAILEDMEVRFRTFRQAEAHEAQISST
jgi:hypothetical protein